MRTANSARSKRRLEAKDARRKAARVPAGVTDRIVLDVLREQRPGATDAELVVWVNDLAQAERAFLQEQVTQRLAKDTIPKRSQ